MIPLFKIRKTINLIVERITSIESRLEVTQDGELRRMLGKANETIKKLEKENKKFKLMLEIKHMTDSLEKEEE